MTLDAGGRGDPVDHPDFDGFEFLGEGATGTVWKACNRRNGALVAIKVLGAAHASPAHAARLAREARIGAGFHHPNLVAVHGLHRDAAGRLFIEMEWIDGGDLAALAAARGGWLPWGELKPLVLQLCEALEHAHAQGVVHRDLKPSNVLVDRQGRVKLGDFGCASLIEETLVGPATAGVLAGGGTLSFMSPQQIGGRPPTASDDLYALGVLIHTLLASVPPFSPGPVIPQILAGRRPSLARHQRRLGIDNPVPARVAAVVRSCMRPTEGRRPPGAAAIAEALRADESTRTWSRRALLAGMPLAAAAVAVPLFRRGLIIPAADATDVEPGFEALFNGRNLDGWSGDAGVWSVRDGLIHGMLEGPRTHDGGGWRKSELRLDGPDLADFELRLDVRLDIDEEDAGNLGICYRIGPGPRRLAYELDFEPNWKRSGGIREFGGRDTLARPGQRVRVAGGAPGSGAEVLASTADEKRLRKIYYKNDWNPIVIRAVGNRLIQRINDTIVADVEDLDPAGCRASGGLALKAFLFYGPRVGTWFRRVRLRRL